MRRIFLTVLMLAGVLAFASTAQAASIVDTKHNLSSSQPNQATGIFTTNTTEICVFCHTPHGADTGIAAPLWNRAQTAATFQPYTSPTLDSTVGAPNGTSLACLSCHDGTVAFDALRNQPGSGAIISGDANSAGWVFPNLAGGNKMPAGRITNLSDGAANPDLRNDHPISMRYEDARSPSAGSADQTTGFYAVVTSGSKKCVGAADCSDVAALPLSSSTLGGAADYVQCTSCHDPHRADTPTFLRKANTGSALCLTCHKKDG